MEISEEPKAKPISGLSRRPAVLVGHRVAADQEPVEAGHAQQAQAHHQHAGDGAAAEGHVQRRADALGGGLRGAHVGAHRDVHADEAAGAREHRADDEADGGLAVEEDADQHRQHHADDGDGLVLPRQVGGRAGLDGGCDLLHAGIARVLGKNPATGPEAVGHGNQPADKRQYERGSCLSSHSFSPGCCFAREEAQRMGSVSAALLPRAPRLETIGQLGQFTPKK
jgi:hypothetical protein